MLTSELTILQICSEVNVESFQFGEMLQNQGPEANFNSDSGIKVEVELNFRICSEVKLESEFGSKKYFGVKIRVRVKFQF